MDYDEFEQSTGWRPVFHCLPASKAISSKMILPLGSFYSPFTAEPSIHRAAPSYCVKCHASICSLSARNRQTRTWTCSFCSAINQYIHEVGMEQVEEFEEHKTGESGIFFVIDTCILPEEMKSLKETLIKTIRGMPKNIYVALLAFNRNLFLHDFSEHTVKFICLSGAEDYSLNNFVKLRDCLTLINNVNDVKLTAKTISTKFYVPLSTHEDLLIAAVESIEIDIFSTSREERQKRAVGCALQVAIGLSLDLPIVSRFVTLIGGPCTVGVGKVVDLPNKKTIRSFADILQSNQSTEYMKTAIAFYEGLAGLLVKSRSTMDMWAYGLDQFGLLEMRSMISNTGGLLAMHEQFNYFIFQSSFPSFYASNEQGVFNFAYGCQMMLRVSKDLRVNGIIGACKSLKDNSFKQAAEMEIGEGSTSTWFLGGISFKNSLCVILSLAEAVNDTRERNGLIQAVTTYKLSNNIVRTRVSTISLDYLRENQIGQIIKRFDEEAATVMLTRMVSIKTEVEDCLQVKKWVDRLLLKFVVRFTRYNRGDQGSFKLTKQMAHLPQYIYHLRRSGFINPFGSPPDQSIYIKMCMLRESVANCLVMVQPALLRYTVENEGPLEVELDVSELKDQVILLLDSYFNVLLWMGENVKGWQEQNLQDDPQYQYLQAFFNQPREDASGIIYDRIPSSNFYETFKNDGKERYLKAKVNPSKSKEEESDGHFLSDDASISLFMEYLIRRVVNYNE